MRLLLFGATGMVGFELLHLALVDPRVNSVTTIGRRATGVRHPKLREIVHADMLDLSELEPQLRRADLILYCLGVYQNAVSAAAFWTITCGYLEQLLGRLQQIGADPVFCLMGAQGADPSEKSLFRFAKAKGRAERYLMESSITRKHIFRPGYIKPGRVESRSPTPEWLSRVGYALFPPLGIDAVKLAAVMLEVGVAGSPQVLFKNGPMRRYPTRS